VPGCGNSSRNCSIGAKRFSKTAASWSGREKRSGDEKRRSPGPGGGGGGGMRQKQK